MVRDDTSHRSEPEDMVSVLTMRGRVVLVPGPRRVTFFRPCAIGPTGVRLYRWPMRSIFIPLERVDRFDVVLEQAAMAGDEIEHLVLLTRDGKTIPVRSKAPQGWSGSDELPLRASARQLNNHIMPSVLFAWRASDARADGSKPSLHRRLALARVSSSPPGRAATRCRRARRWNVGTAVLPDGVPVRTGRQFDSNCGYGPTSQDCARRNPHRAGPNAPAPA